MDSGNKEGTLNVTDPGQAQDWTSASLDGLIEHILGTHHVYLRTHLPRLEKAGRHGDVPGALLGVFVDLKGELESHMWKEEMVLFPLIRGLVSAEASGSAAPPAHCGSVRNPVRVMEHEHDAALRALAEMRRLTGDYALAGDACSSCQVLYDGLKQLEADLIEHIRLENDILFPRAAELEARLG